MGRAPRDHAADRAIIEAAAERLLAGAPQRSTSGKLTATELITESGLRRDVLYRHRDLIANYTALAQTRNGVPDALQEPTDRHNALISELASTRTTLNHERTVNAYLRRVIAELSIELDHTRQNNDPTSTITALRPRAGQARAAWRPSPGLPGARAEWGDADHLPPEY